MFGRVWVDAPVEGAHLGSARVPFASSSSFKNAAHVLINDEERAAATPAARSRILRATSQHHSVEAKNDDNDDRVRVVCGTTADDDDETLSWRPSSDDEVFVASVRDASSLGFSVDVAKVDCPSGPRTTCDWRTRGVWVHYFAWTESQPLPLESRIYARGSTLLSGTNTTRITFGHSLANPPSYLVASVRNEFRAQVVAATIIGTPTNKAFMARAERVSEGAVVIEPDAYLDWIAIGQPFVPTTTSTLMMTTSEAQMRAGDATYAGVAKNNRYPDRFSPSFSRDANPVIVVATPWVRESFEARSLVVAPSH